MEEMKSSGEKKRMSGKSKAASKVKSCHAGSQSTERLGKSSAANISSKSKSGDKDDDPSGRRSEDKVVSLRVLRSGGRGVYDLKSHYEEKRAETNTMRAVLIA